MFFSAKLFITGSLACFLFACKQAEKPAESKAETNDTTIIRDEQVNPYAPPDISPMDMSYYPVDYPVLKMAGKISSPPVARVIYSRPHRQGRKIFGSLLKYGEPWRLGANESTEIEFFKAVTIQDKKIAKGRYIMYCIPYQDKWSVVLNSNVNTWGLKINSEKDLQRFEVPVTHTDASIEFYTMIFEKTNTGANLLMTWDDILVRLPIIFSNDDVQE